MVHRLRSVDFYEDAYCNADRLKGAARRLLLQLLILGTPTFKR